MAFLVLNFTSPQPITAAIPPGNEKLFRMALDLAEKLEPITPEETNLLRERAKGLAPLFRLEAA